MTNSVTALTKRVKDLEKEVYRLESENAALRQALRQQQEQFSNIVPQVNRPYNTNPYINEQLSPMESRHLLNTIESMIPVYKDVILPYQLLEGRKMTISSNKTHLITTNKNGDVYKIPANVTVADVLPFKPVLPDNVEHGWYIWNTDVDGEQFKTGTQIHTYSNEINGLIVRYAFLNYPVSSSLERW